MDRDLLQILNIAGCAAAAVRDGAVVWRSEAARRFGLEPGMDVGALLPEGVSPGDLAGMQMLSLPALGPSVSARVCPWGEYTVLVLEQLRPALSYDAVGQIHRVLSGPVDDIMFTARGLFERLEALEDPQIQAGTARLNRDFYRLLRMSASLSDLHAGQRGFSPARTDLRLWLQDLEQRLRGLVAAAGRQLSVGLPERRMYASVDADLLEQAVLSLLSNAIRYSPAGSTVTLHAQLRGNQCLISLQNPVAEGVQLPDLSGAFTRPPIPGDSHGLGLGLRRVQTIAEAHGGVLLLECTPAGEFSASLCVPCDRAEDRLHRPAVAVDRSGGYSRLLVELSEVLPDSVFDSRNF